VLREFLINPADQKMEPFFWVMNWEPLIPTDLFVTMWVNEFFNKWLDILYAWLVHDPHRDEIVKWYFSWKKTFGTLAKHPQIEEQFRRGLDMMNQVTASPDMSAVTKHKQ